MDAQQPDSLAKFVPLAVAVLSPLLKFVFEWFKRISRRRIYFVVWKEGQVGNLDLYLYSLVRFLAFWRAAEPGPVLFSANGNMSVGEDAAEANILSAQLFLWNGGKEDIDKDVFFDGNPLHIDLVGGEIRGYELMLLNSGMICPRMDVVTRESKGFLHRGSSKVITLRIDHWSPGSGIALDVQYHSRRPSRARFLVAGPMREMKEPRRLGSLWRLNLAGYPNLSSQALRIGVRMWIFTGAFLAFVAVMFANVREWSFFHWQYWVTMCGLVLFELLALGCYQTRRQLKVSVVASLRYWLPPT